VEVELLLVALEGGCSRRLGQDVALDEVVALGAVREALLEVVCCALALELEGPGLEGTLVGVSLVMWRRGGSGCRQGRQAGVLGDRVSKHVRRSSCVDQDVSVLEVLGLWAVLQVLFQAVAPLGAADGREGRDVDGGVFGSHGARWECVWR
jgi:hypothetical protein